MSMTGREMRIAYLVGSPVLVGLYFLGAVVTQTSNCGGNSAALSNVRRCALFLIRAADSRPDRTFLPSSATASD